RVPGALVGPLRVIPAGAEVRVAVEDGRGGYAPGDLAPAPRTAEARASWNTDLIPYRRLEAGSKQPVTATPEETQAITFTADVAGQVYAAGPEGPRLRLLDISERRADFAPHRPPAPPAGDWY